MHIIVAYYSKVALLKSLYPLGKVWSNVFLMCHYCCKCWIHPDPQFHNDRVSWLAHHAETLYASCCAAYAYTVMLQADYW